MQPYVPIILNSKGDFPHGERLAKELRVFGIESCIRVTSPSKTPALCLELIAKLESLPNPKVYVCSGSRDCNSLASMVDGQVSSPVIICPPPVSSSAPESAPRTSTGVCPLLILDAQNCALACAKVFAISLPSMKETVKRVMQANAASVFVKDCEVKAMTYVPVITRNLGNTFNQSNLELKPKRDYSQVIKYVGKVRDRYDDGKNVILVTTDRLTGFDRSLCKIPFKGMVLNLVSKFWFEQTKHIIPNHFLSSPHPNVTVGVSVKPFPIEFVVRAYLTGSSATSMWTHYSKGVREYCGIKLPEGMVHNQKLWENLITPTTKSDQHDELITPQQIVSKGYMTQEEWDYCSAKALELFEFASKRALERGLILVDTKMEMGRDMETGEILLIDELFTPDSSRYWFAAGYEMAVAQGKPPSNIDKEFVRLWFKEHCDPYNDKVLPEPPSDILVELAKRYVMLYELITGLDFQFPPSSLKHDVESVNQLIQKALDLLEA